MKNFFGTTAVTVTTPARTVAPRPVYVNANQVQEGRWYIVTWVNKKGETLERLIVRKNNIIFSFRPAGADGSQGISMWNLETEIGKFNQSYTTITDVTAKFGMVVAD